MFNDPTLGSCEDCPDYEVCQSVNEEIEESIQEELDAELEDELDELEEVPQDLEEFIRFDVPVTHIYTFPTGNVVVEDVEFALSLDDRTQLLEDVNGRKFIVPSGWLCLELDIETWDLI